MGADAQASDVGQMLKFSISNSGYLQVIHQDVSPTAYLDHWALRRFSEDAELAIRLTAALGRREGTLALSWVNLAEFTKVTSTEQARKAEEFVEAILPRVFFLDGDFATVIRREDALIAGGPPIAPHADEGFAKALAGLKPKSLKPFTAHELFRAAQDKILAVNFDNLADTIVDRVEALRGQLDSDVEFRSNIRRSPGGPQLQRGTRFILRELVRALLVDKQTKMNRNQAIDLLHAVVPIAYCDVVLLDKHWETQVERARARLKNAGVSVPIARVFSSKGNGIDEFLRQLESSEWSER